MSEKVLRKAIIRMVNSITNVEILRRVYAVVFYIRD